MSARVDPSMIRFGVAGVANTCIGLAIIYAAKWFLGVGDVEANVTGYSAGVLLSFAFNKRWTFGHPGGTLPAFFRFLAVLGIAYLLNLLTVIGALGLGIESYVAQALGVIPYAVFSYLGCKHLVFPAASTRTGSPTWSQ